MFVPDCAGVPDEYSPALREFNRAVTLLREDGEIKLEVSDEGAGISAATQSKVAAGETAGVGLRECGSA